jgi:UDP-2,4-diacetamido-2,4,6-trideoxy-beta-L-altropyranose hydrolase
MQKILIRTDASPEIGTGHVMRCLALAEAWQDYWGKAVFILGESTPSLEQRLISEGMDICHLTCVAGSAADAYSTIGIAKENDIKWIVVDGYQFGGSYQKIIRDNGQSLLFIDDYGHSDNYYADIILNQNLFADMSYYKNHELYSRFLLGTRYVLLRREFQKWADCPRIINKIGRKVLVSFGGSDADNITGQVLEALKVMEIEGLEVIAVIGGCNRDYPLLKEIIGDRPNFSIKQNVSNMPDLMAWADIAICAGGTTCWELAFMGLPAMICPIAENQKPNVAELSAKGIVRPLSEEEISDPEGLSGKISNLLNSFPERCSYHHKMKDLVDGEGTSRVLMIMNSHRLRLRNVKEADCALVYSWINDPGVRSNSFHPEKITEETHINWFSHAISDKNLNYYIAVDGQENPIGQVRFTIKNEEAVISVLVRSDQRNKGLGSELIVNATLKFFNETKITIINAYVKIENKSSLKSFIRAGYTRLGIVSKDGQDSYHFIKIRGL